MAATFDFSAQFERDLRSANKERKRSRDSRHKWAMGVRRKDDAGTLDGIEFKLAVQEGAKLRPQTRHSDRNANKYEHLKHNMVKRTRGNADLPPARVLHHFSVQEELADPSTASPSIVDLLVPADRNGDGGVVVGFGDESGVLYSFDRLDTPGLKPVTLDGFVKAPSARATEKMVEKEYEILDGNGEAIKGRKARLGLRKSADNQGLQADGFVEVEDGFELV